MSPCRHSSIVILLVFAALRVCAAPPVSSEPNMSCPGDYSSSVDNCVATLQYQNGFIYGGELHHGMREGFGFLVVPHVSDRDILSNKLGDLTSDHGVDQNSAQAIPQITVTEKRQLPFYAGEFRGDKLNGHGVWWFPETGKGYSVTYVDNVLQEVTGRNCTRPVNKSLGRCVDTYRYPNGNIYYGEFDSGLRQGIGLLEIVDIGISNHTIARVSAKGVYVGEFKDGLRNGRGMVLISGGGYYGMFKDHIYVGVVPTDTSEHNQ